MFSMGSDVWRVWNGVSKRRQWEAAKRFLGWTKKKKECGVQSGGDEAASDDYIFLAFAALHVPGTSAGLQAASGNKHVLSPPCGAPPAHGQNSDVPRHSSPLHGRKSRKECSIHLPLAQQRSPAEESWMSAARLFSRSIPLDPIVPLLARCSTWTSWIVRQDRQGLVETSPRPSTDPEMRLLRSCFSDFWVFRFLPRALRQCR